MLIRNGRLDVFGLVGDFRHLDVDHGAVLGLFVCRFIVVELVEDLQNNFELHDSFLEHLLLGVYFGYQHVNIGLVSLVLPEDLLVHLQCFLEQGQGILAVSSLEVASSKEAQNVGVVLLALIVLHYQRPIKLESIGEMVQSLFEILVVQVRFT